MKRTRLVLLIILVSCLTVFLASLLFLPRYQNFYRNLSPKNLKNLIFYQNPRPDLMFYSEGKSLAVAGKFDEALAKLNKAVKLNPRLGKAYLMIGVCHSSKNEPEKAIEALNRAIGVDIDSSNKAVAHYNLGGIYFKDKLYERSIEHFEKAMELAPHLKHETMDPFGALILWCMLH